MPPRVTVLMSVYNDEKYAGAAIESILRQTFTDFEFLIVNDGSTDRSREIIQSFSDPRIRLVDNERNIGLTPSLNRGLAIAQGALIARFDSNDISRADRLEKQVAFMDANPAVAVLGSQIRFMRTNGRVFRHPGAWKPVTPLGIRWYFMFDSPLNHTAAMFRLKVIRDEFGGYDECFTVGQDADLWFRVAGRYLVANLLEPLVDVRIDPLSTTGNAASPRRAGHADRWRLLAHAAMRRYLENEDIPDAWPERWVRLNAPGPSGEGDNPIEVLALLDAMLARFRKLNPAADRVREIVHHVVGVQARVAFRLVERRRPEALVAFARAVRTDAAFASAFAPKFLGLFLFGERARRIGRRGVS